MPFPSPATNGQTYTAGGFVYTYNSTKKLWVKTGYASTVEIGNVAISANASTITVGNTSITANAISVGNTSITANAISIGNTTITANAITVGNTSIRSNAITVGNTSITANAITVGNTSITANAITVGNTRITTNTVSTGNTTISPEKITTGNTIITANSITTGNVSVSDAGIVSGNAVISSNGSASFTSISASQYVGLSNNISLLQLTDVDWQTTNVSAARYLADGNFLKYDFANDIWIPGTPGTETSYALVAENATLANLASNALFANVANLVLTLSNFTTSNLREGSNLYFTNARARTALTGGLNIDYNPTTGNIALVNNPSFGAFTAANGIITGNLVVLGNLIAQASAANTLDNPIVYLANNNVTDIVDIGFVGSYKPAGDVTRMTGLFRDATDTKYKLFQNGLYNVSTTVNTGDGAFTFANLQVDTLFGKVDFANIQNKPDPVITVTLTGNVTGTASATLQDLASNTITIDTTLTSIPTSTITQVLQSINNGSGLTTSNVAEGANLYYTNARVFSNVALMSINVLADVDTTGISTGNTLVWDGTKFIVGTAGVGAGQTVNLANVSNFSNTSGVAGFANTAGSANVSANANFANVANTVISLANFTTSNVNEGSNLYFTNSRVIAALNNSTLGEVYIANLTAGNISYAGNLTVGNIVSAHGFIQLDNDERNTIIQAGIWSYRFDDNGNFYTPNIIVTGAIFGNISGNISVGTLSQEQVQDFAAPLFTGGSHSGISFDYDDTNNRIVATVTGTGGGGGSSNYSNTAGVANVAIIANTANTASTANFANTAGVANVAIIANFANTTGSANVAANANYANFAGTAYSVSGANVFGAVGQANFANTTGTANVVLSLSNFTTSNLAEGTNLYYTNARVIAGVTEANISNLTVTGNVVALRFIGDGSGLTGVTAAGTSANLTGKSTTDLAEGANLYYTNARVLSGVSEGNISNLTITGNVIATRFIGDGSGLTGLVAPSSTSNLALLPTYNGNALLGNVVITGNATLGNVLFVTGNVSFVGNVTATRYLGNGALLTGITTSTIPEGTNLYYTNARVAAFVANTNLSNLTITGNTRVGNLLIGTSVLTTTLDNNTQIIANAFTYTFSDTGVATFPGNVVATRFIGDGAFLTNISLPAGGAQSNLAQLPIYNGNALLGNLVISGNSTTGNVLIVNGSASVTGNLVAGNVSASRFAGDGSQITNLNFTGKTTTDLAEGNNLYYTNDRVWANVTSGISTFYVREDSNLYYTNARVLSYVSNVSIANLTVSNIRIGQNSSITATFDANTTIQSNGHVFIFGETGLGVFPNVSVRNNLYISDKVVYSTAARVAGNIVPLIDNQASLGSPTNRFRDLYIGGSTIDIGTALFKFEDGKFKFQTASGAPAQTEIYTGNIIERGDTTSGNVYFTNARARSAFSEGTGISINTTTGVIGIGQNVSTTASVSFRDITLSGNLTVLGTTTTINARELSISDNMIYLNQEIPFQIVNAVGNGANVVYTTALAHGAIIGETVRIAGVSPISFNTAGYNAILAVTSNTITIASAVTDTYISGGNVYIKRGINPDLGFAGGYNDGTGYAHTGFFRDATDGTYKIFEGYTPEPDANIFIDTSNSSFRLANLLVSNLTARGNIVAGNIIATSFVGDGSRLTGITASGVTGVNTSNLAQLPTYNGNALVGNIVVSGNATTGNILIVQGNASIGNLVITGKLLGDGSGLTGISAGAGASTSNLAQLPTYNGNALLGNLVISGNATTGNLLVVNGNISVGNIFGTSLSVSGNVTANNINLGGAIYSVAADNNTQIRAGIYSYTFGDTGFATFPNLTVSGNITANNISLGGAIYSNASDNNTQIRAGIWSYTFSDVGNLLVPNLVVSGKLFGDGSALTGITATSSVSTSNLAQLPTYNGNALVGNIVVSGNASTGNILVVTGNASIGNVYATRFIGDGSLLTGISASSTSNLSQLPTYNGNALVGNLVISGNATTGNILVVNGGASITGNLVVGNVIGSFSGSGALLTGITTTIVAEGAANLYYTNARVASYVANVQHPNLTVSGNISTGNILVSNFITKSGGSGNLTLLTSGNIVIDTGPFETRFFDSGNVSFPGNVIASSFFVGNGALLTGISTSLTGMSTYAGNILASNIVVTGNATVLGNLNLGNAGLTALSLTGDSNTQIRAGIWQYTFSDTGLVTLPNVTVTGNINVGNNSSFSVVNDNNTIIQAGVHQYRFLDTGFAVLPNVTVSGNLVLGNASILTTPDNNTQIRAGIWTYTFTDTGIATFPNVTVSGNLVLGNASLLTTPDNNTQIRAGIWTYTFTDTGNLLVPNISVTGNIVAGNIIATKYFGDGSALTGLSAGAATSNLTQLPSYNGNILAGNIVISGNATTGNILVVLGNAFLSGNVVAGNISANTITAIRFTGNGTALTGINTFVVSEDTAGGNLYYTNARVLTYVSNVTLPNITASNFSTSGRFYGNITGNVATYTGNISVGNIVVGNVISTPAGSNANLIIDPDGTGEVIFPVNTEVVIQSTIQANSNVTGALIVTGGIGVGGNIYSGANIVATGNVIGAYFLGNGALLTGISTSLTGMSTYGGNILASNIVVTGNLTVRGNLNIANTTINTTGDNNTQIRAGIWQYTFSDTGIATLPNVTVTGNITVGNNTSFSVVNDNNTTIRAGNFTTQFLDNGNLSVGGNIIATGRISGDGSGLSNVIVSIGNQGQATLDATIRSRSMMYSILFR